MTGHDREKRATTANLHLEWKILDDDRCAMVFDQAALTILRRTAEARGVDTADMVAEAIASLLGTIAERKVTERD